MTDDQWLQAMDRHSQAESNFEHGGVIGGALELSRGLRGCFEKGHGARKGGSGVGFPYLTSGCTPAPPAIPYRGAPCHVNPTPVI